MPISILQLLDIMCRDAKWQMGGGTLTLEADLTKLFQGLGTIEAFGVDVIN